MQKISTMQTKGKKIFKGQVISKEWVPVPMFRYATYQELPRKREHGTLLLPAYSKSKLASGQIEKPK